MTEQYIGVKVINAKQMTRGEYNTFRGWVIPLDENPNDAGYLVEYLDGGKPNTDHFSGYVSWSPAPVFDNAYRKTEGMPFGLAIEALRLGKHVSRNGWNGAGMWLELNNDRIEGDTLLPFITLHYPPTAKITPSAVVPWTPSQTDVLAQDWQVVE